MPRRIREAEARLREARATIATVDKWEGRRAEFVDALLEIAADPHRILALPPVALKDALRALCGRVTVGRDKVLRFPPDSTVEVLRAISADESSRFNFGEIRGATSGLLNPARFAGVVAAARLLRA